MHYVVRNWLAVVISLLLVQLSAAKDLFRMDLTSRSGSAVLSGPNIENVFIRALNYFKSHDGPGTAVLNYAGSPNAMTLSFSPNSMVTLTIPRNGFTRTFANSSTNAPGSGLSAQIRRFLRKEGVDQLARLQREVNASSLVAITDGTPHSSTALLADRSYEQFGTDAGQTREEKQNGQQTSHRIQLSLMPDVGWIDAGGFRGTTWKLPLGTSFKLNDRTDLLLDATPSYIEIESAEVYQVAMGLGMPVKILKGAPRSPWLWRVTPSVGAIATGSEDYDTGGWVIQGGLTSLAAYEFKHFALSMGNHFSFFESTPLSVGEYEFDADVSQQILKNGLNLSVPVSQRWIFQFYGIHTHFTQHAAVDDYFTIGGNVAYRFQGANRNILTKRGSLFLGCYTDLAKHYSAPHVRLGTAWKF